jgi:thioredoxin-like negative regulator of GroEL
MTKYLLFTGEKCTKCGPMKERLYKAAIKFENISTDVKSGAMMAGMYKVMCLPTLVVIKGGKPMESFPGLLPMSVIEKIKDKYAHR